VPGGGVVLEQAVVKVMTPPFPTAVVSAANVQLAEVPVPITVVGFEMSAG
jgi:hypothetical protein